MVFRNKRGQVTIFIIIAVVIVGIIIYFIATRSAVTNNKPVYRSSQSPQEYIAGCVEDAVRPKITLILNQGGFIQPELNTSHEGVKVGYACYTSLRYSACINQVPVFLSHIDNELKNSVKDEIENCFVSMKEDFESKGARVEVGNTESLDVSSSDKKVSVLIKKEVTITEKETTKNYQEFKTAINSPMYNLARVGVEIISQEAIFCHSEYLGYQTLHPWVRITRNDYRGDHKVYEIKDRATGEQLNLAIRSCAIPPGIF